MRVAVHPADEGGCGSYRMRWPAETLQREGRNVRIERDRTYDVARFPNLTGHEVLGIVGDRRAAKRLITALHGELALAKKRGATMREQERISARYADELRRDCERTGREGVDADVVVMQRILSQDRYETLVALQASGVAVVVEIDDDFHSIHPRNPAWKGTNPLEDPTVHRDWLMRACERADLVTVTTPALARRYGAHGRVRVIDNYVPARYLDARPALYTAEYLGARPEKVTVGWTGSVVTHPGDLEVTGGGVAGAIDDVGAELLIVGTGLGAPAALGYTGAWSATGWLPIEAYPEAMRRIDVGIVPLVLSPFNEAKSHLKGLEFAAAGVPFVASPTGPYRRLAEQGLGVLADSPAAWRDQVRRLARDVGLRNALGRQYREMVEAHWTLERNAWRWWDAWAEALEYAEKRKAAA